ncbi:MAG: SDR family oxidoreductase [Rhodobacteraceae bacterium]|nr:SDR family oxidoreductase [Paracoccaceae bacterium]
MTQNIALVTGASRGLGSAIAEQLALRGWHVVAVARTVGGLEDLDDRVKKASAPGAVTLAPMDIIEDDAMRHLCRSIHDRWGGLKFWAHTAIRAESLTPAASVDMKDLDESVAVNLRATAFLITMVEPLLRAGSGTAMFFDDPVATKKFAGTYGATKAGQMALARNWQTETRRIGPRVLVETPQPMPTAVRARFYPSEDRSPLTDARDEAARLIGLI